MIERVPKLPIAMQKHLRDDRAQISDKEFFVIRELVGTSTDIIKKNEKSEDGLRNIDDAELNENQHFLLSAISLQYRSGTSGRFGQNFILRCWEISSRIFLHNILNLQYYFVMQNKSSI